MKSESKVPLYYQLVEIFEEKIADGTWAKGTKIPSERVLSEQYGVSRITVRGAIEELSRSGMVDKIQGKGTFVISKQIVQDLGGIYGFSDEMRKQGRISYTKVVTKEVITASKKTAETLNINIDDKVIFLERLRFNENDEPIMLEKTYFPYDKYQFMLEENLDEYSLYELLEQKYNVVYDSAVERFKACRLNASEAVLLKAERENQKFGLLIRRVSYIDGKVENFSSIVTKGDIFEFTVRLGAR